MLRLHYLLLFDGRWLRDYLVIVIVVIVTSGTVVKGHYRVLLTEGPPPSEACKSCESKVRVPFAPQCFDEIQNIFERFFCPSVIWGDGNVTTELEYGRLFVQVETGLLEDHHPVGLAEYVIVEGALGDAVVRGRLREPHRLCYYGLDSVFQLRLRPCWNFHFQ